MEEKVFEMLRSQVYLSGMPELRLGLNDKVMLHATVPFLKIFWPLIIIIGNLFFPTG